jgi:hypothetical protein
MPRRLGRGSPNAQQTHHSGKAGGHQAANLDLSTPTGAASHAPVADVMAT